MAYPLEPGPEQMRTMGEAALGYLIEFVQSQDEAAAMDVEGAIEAARSVRGTPPDGPGSFDQLMDTVDLIAANSYNTTGPGFLPFIPGGGLYASALGDFLATGINRFVNMWGQAPVGAQIEHNVVRWLCDLFGSGDEAPVSINIQVTNNAAMPLRIREVEITSPGMMQYSVPRVSKLFNETVAPGETRVVGMVASAIARQARVDRYEPLSLRAVIRIEGGGKDFREIVFQQIAGEGAQ